MLVKPLAALDSAGAIWRLGTTRLRPRMAAHAEEPDVAKYDVVVVGAGNAAFCAAQAAAEKGAKVLMV